MSDRTARGRVLDIPTASDIHGLQLVLFWHQPKRCSCSGTLPTFIPDTPAKPLAAMVVLDTSRGRYVQLCVTHGSLLGEVKESRKAPHGLWCDKGQHAPETHFALYDTIGRRAVKVALKDPEDDNEDLVQEIRKRV